MDKINEIIARIDNKDIKDALIKEISNINKTSIEEEHLKALIADYLNVYILYPNEDSADIIKLAGYVTTGITDVPKGFKYSKLLQTYAKERVCQSDRESFLNKLSIQSLINTFADGREKLEFNYRIISEDGKIHHYAARYSRISKFDEELCLVVGFRNIDYIVDITNKKHFEGLRSAYTSISSIFFSLHRVNIIKNTYTTIKTTDAIEAFSVGGNNYDVNVEQVFSKIASKWSRKEVLEYVKRSTIEERMKGKTHIYMEFLSYASVPCKLHFFREDEDESGRLKHVILAVEREEEEKSRAVIKALSRDYQNVFLIELDDSSSRIIKLQSNFSDELEEGRNFKFNYERICKKYIYDIIYPEDLNSFIENVSMDHLRKYFQDHNELTGSFRILTDNTIHHYSYTYYKLDGLNSVLAGFRNVDDIIARHTLEEKSKHEKELAYQNQLKEQLVIVNTLASNFKNVYYVDLQKEVVKILKLDSKYDEILGLDGVRELPFKDILQYWIEDVVCDEDRAEIRKVFEVENVKKELAFKNKISGNYRSIVDGKIHHYQYSMRKVDESGLKAVLGFQNVDAIVEEHMAQEKKEREHAEVISSLSTIYSTIFRANIDTHHYDVLTSVPLMGNVAGKSGNFDDVKEKIIDAFMAPEERDKMFEFLDLNTLANRLENSNTISIEYKNPTNLWFQSRFIVKRRDENNIVKEVLYVARNITDEKVKEFKQQEQLSYALAAAQQASKAKSIFLNSMSHDIRTPMNAIIGFTALAQTHIDNKVLLQDYLTKISTSSTHLLSLINDILDMSRIESGNVKLDEKPVHIPNLLHDLRIMIQGLINSKNLNLYIDTQDVTHEDVITDRLRLNQVLINIVGNAIKYTHPGGDIIIRLIEKPSTMKHHRTYVFSVKDTGVGMSKEFCKHIFEAFTREYSSTVSGIQGTGLGMAITKNIVDLMGGEIKVESEEGKGSLFTVTLNLLIAADEIKAEPIPELLGARALVVDDDLNTCRSVSKMLRDIKMRPDWTASGKEAIIRAQDASEMKDEYKVYIVDYLMPDMNGIETVRRIRKVISEDVPIIVLTAYEWEGLEEEARAAGVTAFVSKPLFMSELRKVLTQKQFTKDTKDKKIKQYDYSGKHVLLVEDNELNREIAIAILESTGMKVDIASDGTEAVDIMYTASDDEYDLIFMDIQMPKMDGYTATHEIRTLANNRKANIPIVAMTANAFEEDKRKSFEFGMNGHITKPISIEEIARVLDNIFIKK